MEERLQKYMANSGIASRRKCEGDVSFVKTDVYSLSNKIDSLSSDIDMIKYS